MGTSLSFHNRHLYGTNWLVATSLIVLIFSFLNIQQISCAVITDLSSMASSSHSIRHADGIGENRHHSKRSPTMNMNNPYNTLLWTNSKRHFKSESNYYGIFKVRSLCSDKNDGYMNIFQDEIHADGIDSTSNTLQFDFIKIDGTEDQFYIRRRHARKYICFTRRGKLRVKSRPTDDHRCSFKHMPANMSRSSQPDNQFTKIQSVANPVWYIGFKKNSEPMRGFEHGSRREKCFIFELSRANTPDFSRLQSDSPYQSESSDSETSQSHPHRHHKGENNQLGSHQRVPTSDDGLR